MNKKQSFKFQVLSFKLILIIILCNFLFTSSAFAEYLGEFKAGTSVFYGANFHNDTGTIEDPTSPEAQQRTPAGVWSDLDAPAKQNSKSGFFGGTIDTTGYAVGEYIIRMAGTVTTAKTTATIFSFTIVANIESDTKGVADSILSESQSHPTLAEMEASTTLFKVSDYTAPDNPNIGLIKTVTDKFLFDGSNFVKSVEQVLTCSQFDPATDEVDIGKVKGTGVTSVDDFKADVSGLATQTSVDTIDGIVDSILTETQSHPTLAEIEATTVLAKEGNVETHVTASLNAYDPPTRTEATADKDAILIEVNANETKIDAVKTQTDKMNFTGTDIKATLDGEVVITIEGSGDTAVDENTGGADNLRYVYQAQGIDNATIKVYLKTDYDAGNRSDTYVKARSKTKTDGRWQWPVYLDSGFTYSVVFYKQGQYGPTKVEVTIP
jgi:uncharacterized protein YwbE